MSSEPLEGAQLVIRKAQPGEVEGLADLVVRAYEEFRPSMEPAHWAQMAKNLHALALAAPLYGLMVAELDSRIAGTISYHAPGADRGNVGFTRFPPDWALMRILAVEPPLRGRGVGTALAVRCIERARQDGAEVMGLHTSELMTHARRIYQRLGFSLQEETVHLGLRFGVYTLNLRG